VLGAASPSELKATVAAKIKKLVDATRTKLQAAEVAGSGKPALRGLKGAGKQLAAIAKLVRAGMKRKKIGTSVGQAILAAVQGGTSAIGTLKTSITP